MEGYDAGAEQVRTPELTREELERVGEQTIKAVNTVEEGEFHNVEPTELTEETDLILPPEPQPETPSEAPLEDFAGQTPTEKQPEENPAEQINDAFNEAGFNANNQ